MNILCFIENLNAGGAQRQICYLANLLKENNNDVTILTYHKDNFYLNELKKNKIKLINFEYKYKLLKIFKLIKFLKNTEYDVTIAYLRNPSLIAEISRLFGARWKLIVSERNNYINENYFTRLFRRLLHLIADYVIVNSNTNLNNILHNSPWIKRVSLIQNFTDLDYFKPQNKFFEKDKNKITLVGVGKYSFQKNIINLVEALHIVSKNAPELNININWYGDNFTNYNTNSYLNKIRSSIDDYKLNKIFNLNPATSNILEKYHASSALILPSLYEGFPNVVSEAISCGLPALISNICDNKVLVDKSNGYLFDPNNPDDIAEKIISFSRLDKEQKKIMSISSRKRAENLFNKKKYLNSHLNIIKLLNNY